MFARRFLYPGILQLTPQVCEQFNRDTPERSDVSYFSWAGCRPAEEMPMVYRRQARILQRKEDDNDSQVGVQSAIWGTFRGMLRVDHMELAGWSLGLARRSIRRPFDHIAFYQALVDEAPGLSGLSGAPVVESSCRGRDG